MLPDGLDAVLNRVAHLFVTAHFQATLGQLSEALSNGTNGTDAGEATGPVRDDEKYKQARTLHYFCLLTSLVASEFVPLRANPRSKSFLPPSTISSHFPEGPDATDSTSPRLKTAVPSGNVKKKGYRVPTTLQTYKILNGRSKSDVAQMQSPTLS